MILDKAIRVTKSGSSSLSVTNSWSYSDDIVLEDVYQDIGPRENLGPVLLGKVVLIEAPNVDTALYLRVRVFDGSTTQDSIWLYASFLTGDTPGKLFAMGAFVPTFQGGLLYSHVVEKIQIATISDAALTVGKVQVDLIPVDV